jgi:hypothetical protein
MGLSIRAYAQHRGVSHTAVAKAIKAGRISKEPDGSIDPAKADAQWVRNTLPSQNLNTSASKPAPKVATPPVSTPVATGSSRELQPPMETGRISAPDYQTSRAIREAYAARLAKLEYEERTAKLISSDEVEMRTFNLARRLRDRMQTLPRRLAAALAAEQDPRVIEQRLDDEIRQALEELSR